MMWSNIFKVKIIAFTEIFRHDTIHTSLPILSYFHGSPGFNNIIIMVKTPCIKLGANPEAGAALRKAAEEAIAAGSAKKAREEAVRKSQEEDLGLSKPLNQTSRVSIIIKPHDGDEKLKITAPVVDGESLIQLDFLNPSWDTSAPLQYHATNHIHTAVTCIEMFTLSFAGQDVFATVSTFSDDGCESPAWFRWQLSVSKEEEKTGLTLTNKVHHILQLLLNERGL